MLAPGLDRVARRLAALIGPTAMMLLGFVLALAAFGEFVVGCGIGNPDARVACLVLLTHYVNGGSLLAYSAAARDRGMQRPDGQTFHLTRGLAEGVETVIVHTLMGLLPSLMATVAWTFAAVVVVTILQRMRLAHRPLTDRSVDGSGPAAEVSPR